MKAPNGRARETNSVPSHWQRQLMQRILDQGSVRGFELSEHPRTIKILLEKGWIESSGGGRDRIYRVTEEGLSAKRALIPMRRDR